MSSSLSTNISQADTEIQRRYKEKQKLQAYLEEVAETCYIEQATQKIRKVTEAKTQKKAKKQRLIKKKKKKKQLEYLKKLWDEVLAEDTTLLKATKTLYVVEAKQKKVTNISLEDEVGQQLSKKIKKK